MIIDVGKDVLLDVNESNKHIGFSPTRRGIELEYDDKKDTIDAVSKLVMYDIPFVFICDRIVLTQIIEIGCRAKKDNDILVMI